MTCHAYEKMRAVLEELKPLVWLDITHAKIKEALALPCSCGTELEEFYKDGFEDGRIAGFVEANEEKEGDASCPELEKENIAVLVERIKRRSESESPPNIIMESKLDIAQNIIRQLERKLAERDASTGADQSNPESAPIDEDGIPWDKPATPRTGDDIVWKDISLADYRSMKDTSCIVRRLRTTGTEWVYQLAIQHPRQLDEAAFAKWIDAYESVVSPKEAWDAALAHARKEGK